MLRTNASGGKFYERRGRTDWWKKCRRANCANPVPSKSKGWNYQVGVFILDSFIGERGEEKRTSYERERETDVRGDYRNEPMTKSDERATSVIVLPDDSMTFLPLIILITYVELHDRTVSSSLSRMLCSWLADAHLCSLRPLYYLSSLCVSVDSHRFAEFHECEKPPILKLPKNAVKLYPRPITVSHTVSYRYTM